MAKGKNTTAFFCQNCGYESSKWMGQCPACKEWNSFVEETVVTGKGTQTKGASGPLIIQAPTTLNEVSLSSEDRVLTRISELDRVLGGGIVPGSLTLVGGDPGIGKSTLLLQVCRNLSKDNHSVLYISGEESLKQIKMRAQRMGSFSDKLTLLCETDLGIIEETIRKYTPAFVVIDSIQTMYDENVTSAPGSVSQVREATNTFLHLAKGLPTSIFIVGHVTKEGTVAGPRVLEHMVDTVLYFEGDRHASYRILRGVKNRFGSTNEIGVFEMQKEGLVEVTNPSEYMLSGRPLDASGSVVVSSIEGTRPILIEVQALVSRTNFQFAKRSANGTDYNRLNLLMAVLEKRACLQINDCDVYVNVTGGLKLSEPALDLGIIMSVVSCFKNRPIDPQMIVFGEVGLSGEVRAVSQAALRVQEAKKLGFTTCVLPESCMKGLKSDKDIKIIGVNNINEAIELI